jgi:hypothetical protein
MKRLLACGLVCALGALAGTAPKSKEVTFHKDVELLLQKHCQECHRPGEIGPFSLLSYGDARPWAKSIRAAVLQKKMPPWFSDDPHGTFENDRRMTQEEIDTIVAWVDNGAKEGEAKDAPKAMQWSDGWTIGKPDMIVEMPNDFKIPATGTVEYSWIVVPTGITEDKWISKIEVRPSARQQVHHVVVYEREKDSLFMKNAKPGIPFYPPGRKGTPPPTEDKGQGIFEFQAQNKGTEIIGLYVPGGPGYECNPGQARLMKAGSDLVLQLHYTTNGTAATDKTRIGIVFAKEPPKERVFNTFVANPFLKIPAGDPNFPVHAELTLARDVKVQSMIAHMHVRGRSFQFKATYPDGRTETLLDVPKYDFNWQLSYRLAEARRLPKGTKLECIASYDNSPNNPSNPDPQKDVYWGDQSWEEMLAGFVDFIVPVDFQPWDLVRPRAGEKTSH